MEQWQSPTVSELAKALVQAQLALKPAAKDKVNPFFGKKYADLTSVWFSLAPFLEHGIAMTQAPMESAPGTICLETQLTHTSGEWMRGRLTMTVARNDPQGYGSALTYARRYALGCMTGLVTEEDDDGNAAIVHARTAPKPEPVKVKQSDVVSHLLPPRAGSELEQELQASIDAKKKGREDGLEHGRDVVTSPSTRPGIGPQQVQDAPAPYGPSTYKMKIGLQKGQPIQDASDENLDWLHNKYLEKIKDAPTSTFIGEWEEAVMEIRGEMLNRYPDAVGENE